MVDHTQRVHGRIRLTRRGGDTATLNPTESTHMPRDYRKTEILDIIEKEAKERGIPRDDFLRFAYIETGGKFDETAVQPTVAPAAAVKAAPAAKPAAAKPAAKAAATKAPANMFCGTFKAMDGAQQLKAKMAFAGVSSEIRESSGKYRVVSGPYVSKRQAQNDKNKLLKQKIANCWVL